MDGILRQNISESNPAIRSQIGPKLVEKIMSSSKISKRQAWSETERQALRTYTEQHPKYTWQSIKQ